MIINLKEYLSDFMTHNGIARHDVQLPDKTINTEEIKVIMISEVPPKNPDDYFYSMAANPDYVKTTTALFQNAGIAVRNMDEILKRGIYITTAVKTPKTEYTVDTNKIKEHLSILETEINLFPHLKVIMLMGDVAKKAFNLIAKKNIKKNAIPAGSTYKIRNNEYYYGDIKLFPSYIMTGGNILIEKSKCVMISDDIKRMHELL
jgi:uracil-DNA glycosylase